MVSPNRHTSFGYVLYNDMKKKPVALSAFQHFLLETPAAYGLLSQRYAAIVADCPTLELTI